MDDKTFICAVCLLRTPAEIGAWWIHGTGQVCSACFEEKKFRTLNAAAQKIGKGVRYCFPFGPSKGQREVARFIAETRASQHNPPVVITEVERIDAAESATPENTRMFMVECFNPACCCVTDTPVSVTQIRANMNCEVCGCMAPDPLIDAKYKSVCAKCYSDSEEPTQWHEWNIEEFNKTPYQYPGNVPAEHLLSEEKKEEIRRSCREYRAKHLEEATPVPVNEPKRFLGPTNVQIPVGEGPPVGYQRYPPELEKPPSGSIGTPVPIADKMYLGGGKFQDVQVSSIPVMNEQGQYIYTRRTNRCQTCGASPSKPLPPEGDVPGSVFGIETGPGASYFDVDDYTSMVEHLKRHGYRVEKEEK